MRSCFLQIDNTNDDCHEKKKKKKFVLCHSKRNSTLLCGQNAFHLLETNKSDQVCLDQCLDAVSKSWPLF